MNRRELLGRGIAALLSSRFDLKAATPLDADAILRQIQPPVFPTRTFPITQFGALADGEKMCTAAIAAAIRACRMAPRWHSAETQKTICLLSSRDLKAPSA